MSAAEQWFCARNFEGLDAKGKPCHYKRGDHIPGAHTWPTFHSLVNIKWITPGELTDSKPGATSKDKPVTTAPKKVKAKAPEKVAKKAKKTKSAKKAVTKKIAAKVEKPKVAKSVGENTCGVCEKSFQTSRALKVHMRYHN